VLIAAQVLAVLAAVLHVVFFLFESVLWMRPAVFGRFGIAGEAQAATIRPMAYNQGFYNLALAVGVLVGVVLLHTGAPTAGRTAIVFGTACMALAGVVLATTGPSYRKAAAVQFVPAALALLFTVLA
jgi:putative membrane protein